MKVRFLTVFVLIVSMVLPTLGMPTGAAQLQPASSAEAALGEHAEGPAPSALPVSQRRPIGPSRMVAERDTRNNDEYP